MEKKALKKLGMDPIMAKLIREYQLREWPKASLSSQYIFGDVVETILGQQLSNKAAETIIGRFKILFGGKIPKPQELPGTPDRKIRKCGTSWSKIKYIKEAAKAIINR